MWYMCTFSVKNFTTGKSSSLDTGTSLFRSPVKHRKIEKWVTNLDDFEKDVLGRTIYEMYDNGEYPTLKSFVRLMREKIKYRRSITSMRFILQSLDFRLKFLRTLHNLRASGDSPPIFYLDETWVNQDHARKNIARFVWKRGSQSCSL